MCPSNCMTMRSVECPRTASIGLVHHRRRLRPVSVRERESLSLSLSFSLSLSLVVCVCVCASWSSQYPNTLYAARTCHILLSAAEAIMNDLRLMLIAAQASHISSNSASISGSCPTTCTKHAHDTKEDGMQQQQIMHTGATSMRQLNSSLVQTSPSSSNESPGNVKEAQSEVQSAVVMPIFNPLEILDRLPQQPHFISRCQPPTCTSAKTASPMHLQVSLPGLRLY